METPFVKKIYISIIVVIPVQILLLILLQYTGENYFNNSNWRHYDSDHYLSIATRGYELFPCPDTDITKDYIEFCGNTGWFPGYPGFIRVFTWFGFDAEYIAGLISRIFYFFNIYLVLLICNYNNKDHRQWLIAFIAALFFGFIYYHSIHPISMVVFFSLAAFLSAEKKNHLFTLLFCLLPAMYYPSGFLTGASIGIYILLKKETIITKIRQAIWPATGTALGIAAVFGIYKYSVNDWNAFHTHQHKHFHEYNNIISNLYNWILNCPYLHKGEIRIFIYIQSVTVICFFILLSIRFFRKKMYTESTFRWSYIHFLLNFTLLWSIGGVMSFYRSEALMLPAILLMKDFSGKELILVLVSLIAIGIPMCYLYFESVLV